MNVYFLLLLVMALLLYKGIISTLFYSPRKIKIISILALVLMTFRWIALMILFIIKNQNYLYLLKPLVFTNLICIPVCGILSVFIFSRNNKIKLKRLFLWCIILFVAYFIVIYKSTVNINISNYCGYTMKLQLESYCYIILLIINLIFAIKGIKLYSVIYSSKPGAVLIIISASITLLSVILTSINSDFPWLLLGDISWLATMDYGLSKFKR
ncbi:hypothetical protein K9O30_17400 [Clostridium bowmanii]|uniref:hypothetical protein n=1 Tax=Clostridium bowmanii TaxID=132925 RepID=UPI001C0AD6DD|nr:hypothetical protein [Clostridium bowmanii]MBU3191103.1 hypothetical protein [Clostridium bowmanii]MCA1075465.1 hypothetical protein [Clostridium bowmanii]